LSYGAYITAGMICKAGQILTDKAKITSAGALVLLQQEPYLLHWVYGKYQIY